MTQADTLVHLASAATLSHTGDQVAYASVRVGEHRETYAVHSQGFRDWLVRRFYAETTKAPNGQALQNAMAVLEAQARIAGAEQPVYLRVGEHDEKIYLDLGTSDWCVVEIAPFGWHVLVDAPVLFRRSRGTLSLPVPTRGGSIEELRTFVNVQNERDMRLLLAVIHAALHPRGPYPVLILQGEQGAAKSTTARVVKALVDPSKAPLRSKPRDESDLLIGATHAHVLAFDNLSELPPWLSDSFCRLASGGGLSKRQLYTDGEEFLLEAQRPLILNGIEDLAVRDDLRDRAVVLNLPSITDDARRDEEMFWARFSECHPALLGLLLDGVSAGLSHGITVKLPAPPRMADFAVRAVAAMPAFGWTGEQFLEDYAGNRRDAVVIVLEASAVATTLRALVESPTAGKPWCGTASELLKTLNQLHDDGNEPRAPGWPQSAQALGNHVRRLAPALRVTNIDVAFRREPKTGRRLITVEKRASRAVTLVTSVTPTAEGAKDDEKIARDGLAPTNDRRFPHGGDESDDVLPWISMAAGPGLDAEVPLPSELCGPGPGEAAWAAGLEDA